MKRTIIKRTLGVAIVAMAVATLVFWGQISEAFGPMRQTEIQCLICHRQRVEKWVCGSKVLDEITTNECSDWMDTFTPLDHQHVWLGGTAYNRTYWFGSKSIACGGMPTIPTIFAQRSSLGERKAQQLAARFQEVVKSDSSKIDFTKLDSFTRAVVDDPESLLKAPN